MPFFTRVMLTLFPGGGPVEARSFDISVTGVGLVSSLSLAVGQVVRLAFHLRDRSGRAVVEEILGRIVHTRADEHGNTLEVQFLATPDTQTTPVLLEALAGD
jgi:hypothetical protein